MREKIAAAVLLGINNTWELGDQALASEITRAILALKVAGVPLSELIEKAEGGGLAVINGKVRQCSRLFNAKCPVLLASGG